MPVADRLRIGRLTIRTHGVLDLDTATIARRISDELTALTRDRDCHPLRLATLRVEVDLTESSDRVARRVAEQVAELLT